VIGGGEVEARRMMEKEDECFRANEQGDAKVRRSYYRLRGRGRTLRGGPILCTYLWEKGERSILSAKGRVCLSKTNSCCSTMKSPSMKLRAKVKKERMMTNGREKESNNL